MTIADVFLLALTGGIGFLIMAWIQQQRREREFRKAQQNIRIAEIREFQEQIGKVKTAVIKQESDYKSLKEKYDAKYRRPTPSSPSSPSSSDDSGSGRNQP